MANNQKKYASLSTLQTFLNNLKNLFMTKTDVITELAKKADSSHDHNDKYYLKNEVDFALSGKSDTTHNHDSDYADIDHNHNGVYAVEGHNHDDKYDAKNTASSAVSTHNTSTSAHNDIRLSITELTTKLNNFLDVDDTTTDQLSELLTLIENNATDIESITNGKVNVSDIIDNLTTNVSNKPLSAAQGVEIKRLIDALQSTLDKKTEIYWISTSYDNTAGGTYTDKTFEEMYDAIYSDKILMLVYGTMVYHYKTDYSNRIEFFAINGRTLYSISVDTDGLVTATSIDVAKSNHTHDYLPLTGGSLSNATTMPLLIENTTSGDPEIRIAYMANGGVSGFLGFQGENNPTFWDKDFNAHGIYHEGNPPTQVQIITWEDDD